MANLELIKKINDEYNNLKNSNADPQNTPPELFGLIEEYFNDKNANPALIKDALIYSFNFDIGRGDRSFKDIVGIYLGYGLKPEHFKTTSGKNYFKKLSNQYANRMIKEKKDIGFVKEGEKIQELVTKGQMIYNPNNDPDIAKDINKVARNIAKGLTLTEYGEIENPFDFKNKVKKELEQLGYDLSSGKAKRPTARILAESMNIVTPKKEDKTYAKKD